MSEAAIYELDQRLRQLESAAPSRHVSLGDIQQLSGQIEQLKASVATLAKAGAGTVTAADHKHAIAAQRAEFDRKLLDLRNGLLDAVADAMHQTITRERKQTDSDLRSTSRSTAESAEAAKSAASLTIKLAHERVRAALWEWGHA